MMKSTTRSASRKRASILVEPLIGFALGHLRCHDHAITSDFRALRLAPRDHGFQFMDFARRATTSASIALLALASSCSIALRAARYPAATLLGSSRTPAPPLQFLDFLRQLVDTPLKPCGDRVDGFKDRGELVLVLNDATGAFFRPAIPGCVLPRGERGTSRKCPTL